MTGSLAADSICKAFGQRKVLASATVVVRAGAVTALLGRNGSGKSTLMAVLAGMLAPDQGTVRLDGAYFPRPSLARLARRGVFLLPADRLPLSPAHTLRTHLDAVRSRFGPGPGLPEGLEVEALLDRWPGSLSGGERKRAALGLAFARAPRFLLLDEPFRDLAPLDAERVAGALRSLAVAGTGVLLTGHETATVLEAADEVVWLTAGTTHALGAPARARARWEFRREFLGVGG